MAGFFNVIFLHVHFANLLLRHNNANINYEQSTRRQLKTCRYKFHHLKTTREKKNQLIDPRHVI